MISRYLACPSGGLKGKIAPTAMPTLAVGAFLMTLIFTISIILTKTHKSASIRLQRDCLAAIA